MNGSRKMKQMKAKTNMGEIHHRYVWYDDSSKQSVEGQASISQETSGQRRLDEDMLREEECSLFLANFELIKILTPCTL